MTTEMITPYWMREQITAEQYDSWSEERCADIEIVDGLIHLMAMRTLLNSRSTWKIANALDRPDLSWRAASNVDLRVNDEPLLNRRPDVFVYRADTIDINPTRPEHVLLVVEVVSPGSETTDRVVKPLEYARAGIRHYWRVEGMAAGQPIIHTHELDPGSSTYRAADVFDGLVKVSEPFPVELDLRSL